MFNLVKMSRLEGVLLKKDARSVLNCIGAVEAVEFARAAPGPDTAPSAAADNSLALADCAAFLGRVEALRAQLGLVPGALSPAPEMDLKAAAAALEDLELKAASPLGSLRGLRAEYKRLSAESERLSVYLGLPLPAGIAGNFSYLYSAAGSVPAAGLAALRAKIAGTSVLAQLGEKEGRSYIAVLGGRCSGAVLTAGLEAAGFRAEELAPGEEKALGGAAAKYYYEAGRVKRALELAGEEISSLAAAAAGPLEAAGRAAVTEARLLEAEQFFPGTGASFYISGWVPEEDSDRVKKELGRVSRRSCALATSPAAPGGEPPVKLNPPRLLRPFAALVTGYGLPRYGEADPTVFSALSFLLMFGMMFGDAGHGAALCLAGYWLARLRQVKAPEAGRAVFVCGMSSIFFGLVYGSFFGLENFKKYALWRDPLAGDPLALLAAAVLIGAAVISLGVIINIVNRARTGDRLGAVLDRFGAAGLVFYWGALLLAAGRVQAGFALPLIAAAMVCWALKAPLRYLLLPREAKSASEDGLFGVGAGALVGAFEGALLYLANTVSFVRLAAYAMSHAALLSAAWALKRTADVSWGENCLAGIFAVIAGNAAAIGFEALVAGVQALRLEYYEFFGKFLEGSGRPFRPFVM